MNQWSSKALFLTTDTAKRLYEQVKALPIIDYHCHLSAAQILANKPVKNLTELWLYGDHYKWRQMRTAGIDEYFITGNADDYDKFAAYCDMLEGAAGNPLLLWSQLELEFYFGVTMPLCRANAQAIWAAVQKEIERVNFSPLYAITKSNVQALCTTEEIYCDLSDHRALKANGCPVKVLPAFRGDRAINVYSAEFKANMQKLSAVTGMPVTNVPQLKSALIKQLDNFQNAGCVAADFALEGLIYTTPSDEITQAVFDKAMCGEAFTQGEAYVSDMLSFLMTECYKRGFAVQLHFGASRNNNALAYAALGADTGYDAISSAPYIDGLAKLLDSLNTQGVLGQTVVFNLNPQDNAKLNTLMGCFQGGVPGKLQQGAAWWHCDTKCGILGHLKCLSETAHLGSFIGMLTDSRSFISYPRHDYFRRLLCRYVGKLAEEGEIPQDEATLVRLVQNVSYYNCRNYFGF